MAASKQESRSRPKGIASVRISTIVMITECLLLEHELVKPALLLIEPASVVLQPPLLLVHLFLLLLSPFMLGIRKLSLLVDPYESLVPLPRSSSL